MRSCDKFYSLVFVCINRFFDAAQISVILIIKYTFDMNIILQYFCRLAKMCLVCFKGEITVRQRFKKRVNARL